MKRKVVRPSDSDRQVKSGQFRRKSIFQYIYEINFV
jgi:hypothetical protein